MDYSHHLEAASQYAAAVVDDLLADMDAYGLDAEADAFDDMSFDSLDLPLSHSL